MFRLFAFIAVLAGGSWFGLALVESYAIYPFDATRVDPAQVGLGEVREMELAVEQDTLVVWTAKPQHGKPVIYYLHGNASNLANRAGRFRRFLDRGYGLVAPAYPGSSGSSGRPSQQLILDHLTAFWPIVKDYADGHRIILYGESIGSAVSIHLLDAGAAHPDATILEAPFTRMRDVILNSYDELEPLLPYLTNIWDNLAHVGGLDGPLFVIHGRKDALIPYPMGQQIHAAAPSETKHLLGVRGGGHSDLWRTDTLPKLWQFIDRHGSSPSP